MTTSGTIGNTRINTAKMLEKAIRRCGLNPAQISPETISSAQESMFMFLLSMTGRGLNLWCVEENLLPLTAGKADYLLPTGTISILNLQHGTPTLVAGTPTVGAGTYTVTLAEAASVMRVAAKFATAPAADVVLQRYDGATWQNVLTLDPLPTVGEYGWYTVPVVAAATAYRLFSVDPALSVSELLLATDVREIDMTQFNRDDYASQPSKAYTSRICTNFYFQKLINPVVTVWPVPSESTSHLRLFRYRQIQDIGRLTNEIEVPARWLEPVNWHLSLRLSYELPGVEPTRRQELTQIAGAMTIETELGEEDGAPIYLAPNIRGYTR